MSIFPKRTIQGKPVTIHWSIAFESELSRPLFPFVSLGVKSPDGEITYLCQKNIMLLPKGCLGSTGNDDIEHGTASEKNNLDKSIPILVLADYLSGKRKKEQLVEILTRIKTARHFYFIYTVQDNSPLGRYELVSEMYLEGKCYNSLTAEEDFFYVEKVVVERSINNILRLSNISPEDCPVKIIDYSLDKARATFYKVEALKTLAIKIDSSKSYVLYNEEREVIALKNKDEKRILRNQTLQNFEKKEGNILKLYVMFPDSDDAYILKGNHLKIWQLADGTVDEYKLRSIDEEAFSSMINANLLHENYDTTYF